MTDSTDIKDSAHDLRNNIHAFEMALVVLEQEASEGKVGELIELLRNETRDLKNNLEHLIKLVESELEKHQ